MDLVIPSERRIAFPSGTSLCVGLTGTGTHFVNLVLGTNLLNPTSADEEDVLNHRYYRLFSQELRLGCGTEGQMTSKRVEETEIRRRGILCSTASS